MNYDDQPKHRMSEWGMIVAVVCISGVSITSLLVGETKVALALMVFLAFIYHPGKLVSAIRAYISKDKE